MGFGSNKGFTPGPDGAGAVGVESDAVIADDAIVRGDGGDRKVQDSLLRISDAGEIGVATDTDLIAPASGTVTFNIGDVAGSDFKVINAGAASVLHVEGDTQRVGIGVTDPDSHLEVFGTGNQLKLSYDATDYVSITHDGSNARITSSAGEIQFDAEGQTYSFNALNDNLCQVKYNIRNTGRVEYRILGGGDALVHAIEANLNHDEYRIAPGEKTGRNLILTDLAHRNTNHDHGVQDNPTLFVHSNTDPAADNTQWVSLTHNQTNAVLEVGKGSLVVTGAVENVFATATAPGAGWNATTPVTSYIGKINGEIVTTLFVSLANTAHSDAVNDVIGAFAGNPAYITRITTAKNGIVYKAEMSCIEVPTVTGAGGLITDIDLRSSSDGTLVYNDDASAAADPVAVITAGANYTLGARRESAAGADFTDLVDGYLYLTAGNSSGGGSDQFTAGKFIIKLYGADF